MKKLLLAFGLFTLLLTACLQVEEIQVPPEKETPVEETSEKVMEPQMFYITNIYIEEGKTMLARSMVRWLSESEGSCRNYSDNSEEKAVLPQCNPNGFLIVEGDVGLISDIPAETLVSIINLAPFMVLNSALADEEGYYQITLDELMTAFEENPDFFEVTPFILEYGTVTVDGVEMSDQVTALKEIYIP